MIHSPFNAVTKKNKSTKLERWRKEIQENTGAEGLVAGLVHVQEGSQAQMGDGHRHAPALSLVSISPAGTASTALGNQERTDPAQAKRHCRLGYPEPCACSAGRMDRNCSRSLGVATPLLASPGEEVLGSFTGWEKSFPQSR